MPQPTERADRILDAAGELMIRLGYRKVTIEDVARQAGVGKGTVYLHWRTKEQLFESLIQREALGLLDELAARLRRDPREIQPHRFMRAAYLITQRHPLLRALATADAELLGNLTKSPVRAREQEIADRYNALIIKHGLVRDDIPHLIYAMNATNTGFYAIGPIQHDAPDIDDETAADVLAHTVRHAFEPDDEPDAASLTSAANEIADLFDELNKTYRERIYAAPGTERG
ncbi:transcriptional regulator, TetR family [Saccharopolyspora kobensis]|uniref:Transcriptional regulator, TetR family n=1 Tax=Saccharopolyspora kobensis TaxID=146035 RepID=A0A1H6DDL8_9PSEU|nr:TetR/AcrR family transcriptional regulator [Saccharopolyspora kobensis]SEG83527.1 transcriptional regulator, TetR family [Saccharopolyspora kobensis]SFE31778.1 transcriptional regulator, TetR family [Saccharopolyspora kobensis]